MKTDCLKDCVEFVITIFALAADAKVQVDFGKRRKCDCVAQTRLEAGYRPPLQFFTIGGQ